MPRSINAGVRAGFEAHNDTDPVLFFLTLEASGLDSPLRLVNDNATLNGATVTYTYGGNSFTAFPFEIEVLTDGEQAPIGRVSIVNVDRRIGEIVRQIQNRVRVSLLTILPASDFVLTTNPRTLISTARPIYTATGLEMRNIKVDAMTATADLVAVDDTAEPWPAIRATQDLLPALYRT